MTIKNEAADKWLTVETYRITAVGIDQIAHVRLQPLDRKVCELPDDLQISRMEIRTTIHEIVMIVYI